MVLMDPVVGLVVVCLSLCVSLISGYRVCQSDVSVSDKAGENSAYLKDQLFKRTTVALRDSDVWIDCAFENHISINWYRKLPTHRKIRNDTRARTTIYNNGTLKISQVKRIDEGTYQCEGTGSDRISQSFTADLLIARIGKFSSLKISPPVDLNHPVIIPQSERFEMSCIRPSGMPTPTIKWQNRYGVRILAGPDVFVEGTKLIFEKIDTKHTSNYTCVAENMAGSRYVTIQIQVTVRPEDVRLLKPLNLTEGEGGQLVCRYNGTSYPWTKVSWLFNKKPVNETFLQMYGVSVDEEMGVLTIRNAHLNLEGNYACNVSTRRQEPVISQSVFVNIVKKLKFLLEPASRKLELNSSTTIECRADAESAPKIRWMTNITAPEVSYKNGKLIFTKITKGAAGEYICIAEYGAKVINKTISILVGVSVKYTVKPENVTVLVGQAVLLHCQGDGDPAPITYWDKDGGILDPTQNHSQLENGSLFIESAKLTDQAIYGCTIKNKMNKERVEVYLIVQGNDTKQAGNDDIKAELHDDSGIGVTKTIVIAVCSAVAHLALAIGLAVWCSIRLMKKKKREKREKKQREMNPEENDELMGNSLNESNATSHKKDSNGYVVMKSTPGQTPVQIEDHDISLRSPSQISSKSTNSSNVRSGNDVITRYGRSKLKALGVLGKGIFGDVFLARAPGLNTENNEHLVFIKSLLSRDEQVQFEFRQEVEMFNKLSHDRICRLLALCKDREPILMIMEYCEWGDLKQFLIATSKDDRKLTIESPDTAQGINMCLQVAQAMEYVTACRFVHKDLASRNILLEPNLNVKVASMALSRDIYASEYVQAVNGLLVPLRWLSPEAWLESDYSTKSDVWSYGCFLYEVFSGAEIPYCNLTNEQVICGYQSGDIELIPGNKMPGQLQTITYQCLSSNPNDRPDFKQIVTMLEGLNASSSL